MRLFLCWAGLLLAFTARAAERNFDFGQAAEGQTPPGFRSAVSGSGKPGEWKVLLEDAPSAFPPLSPQAASTSKRAVLAQLSQDPTDEHFPLLLLQGETYGDFTLTARVKTVRGVVEQMAGVVFRAENESNYYVLRISSLGGTFRFYKVVNGQRQPEVIAVQTNLPTGMWQELGVQCEGNAIHCRLNGRELLPTIHDSSFTRGLVGFWTKSDSVSYFSDLKIVYTPRETPVQQIVRELAKKYPRLLGLKVYIPDKTAGTTRLVASKDEKELGQPGSKTEQAVIAEAQTFYGKEKDEVSVIMPVRDRNGDILGAARVVMKSFPGQTEENAIIRATPIVKQIQEQIRSLDDLTQ